MFAIRVWDIQFEQKLVFDWATSGGSELILSMTFNYFEIN